MTAGSVGATALVVAWSQVQTVGQVYAVWAVLGLVMATVLYEPAFAVIAKWFVEPAARRRAMTALTLSAALASFIFLPLCQALIDAHGWRDALLILAGVLGAVTMPLHGTVLRRPAGQRVQAHDTVSRRDAASAALRSGRFWALTASFFLGTLAGTALIVHLALFLAQDGSSPAFAAAAVGLIGVMQIPGRLLFGPILKHASRATATVTMFTAIAAGVVIIVTAPWHGAIIAGVCLIGTGNGMATLARATGIADHYGAAAYGQIAAIAACATTGARAAGPVAAALWAAAAGYPALLWTLAAVAAVAAVLAYGAERRFEHVASGPWPAPAR
jgi:predicted MFS family arabinose efflux permease